MRSFSSEAWQRPTPSKLFTPAVTAFVLLMIAGFILGRFLPDFTQRWLVLNPGRIWRGAFWQLLTYPFIPPDVGALIMHGLMVLFMGSAVERQWRTLSFLGLWSVVSLGVGLCWALVSSLAAGGTPLAGAGGLVFGLVAAMGVLYRGRRVMFFMATVEMQVLALIVIGIGLLMCIMNPLNLILVLGAPLAYGYVQGIRGIQRRGSDNPGGDFRPGSFVDID